MPNDLTPEDIFHDIERVIAESHALLEKGALMELGGLDGRIKTLCIAVMELPEKDRLWHAGRLQSLFDSLTALGEEMAAQRNALAREILHLSQHKRASVAYHIADSRDGGGKREEE